MNNWFECKVTYEKAGEEGLNTKVNEVYLVDAMNFTEAEERMNREMEPFITGEFNVSTIKKVKIHDLIESDIETDDKWWKCKVLLISIDEDKGVEKTITTYCYVKAENIAQTISYLDKYMESSIYPYRVVSISETLILDVFKYELTTKE